MISFVALSSALKKSFQLAFLKFKRHFKGTISEFIAVLILQTIGQCWVFSIDVKISFCIR